MAYQAQQNWAFVRHHPLPSAALCFKDREVRLWPLWYAVVLCVSGQNASVMESVPPESVSLRHVVVLTRDKNFRNIYRQFNGVVQAGYYISNTA